jgi:transcriptional regulator with XRE-family HTH domain
MRIGEVLRKWRLMSEITMREAAKASGVSLSTWCRVEKGFAPDGPTLARLLNWLMEDTRA